MNRFDLIAQRELRRDISSVAHVIKGIYQLGRRLKFPIFRRASSVRSAHLALLAFESAIPQNTIKRQLYAFHLEIGGESIGDYDSPRLTQVFSNLLNNVAQYKGEKHPVTISTFGDNDATVVQVKNYGPKIPRASLAAVFDPLVQLSVVTDQKGPASTSLGLGLFIARELTTSHGGTIKVESSAEAGTIFTVRLPKTAILGTASSASR